MTTNDVMRLLILSIFVLACTAAFAAENQPVTTLIGAGVRSEPVYDGSDSIQTALIPVIRYYGQPWFLRTTFGMLEGGIRTDSISGITLGLQIAYESGRDQHGDTYLISHNLQTIQPSLSWGAHIEYEKYIGPSPIILLIRYRQDNDTGRGNQTDLRATAGIFSGSGLNAGIFAQTTWVNKTAANYYYGISAQQSAMSSLPAYTAESGAMFNACGLLWSFDINSKWILLGSMEMRSLQEIAKISPIVQQTTSRYTSLGLAYQF